MDSEFTIREQLEGFPLYQIGVVCVMRFAESLAHTQIFPYQFHMIRKFHIAPTESDIFKYNGYLMAAYNISQTISNIFWSKKSNQWGRKTVLMVGLIGNAISMIIYGFSGNFSIAILSKVIGGLSNANMAVTRTILGEIAPERKHHFLSFATFPLVWNLGSIIGPLIGSNLKTAHTWPGKAEASKSGEKWNGGSGSHLFQRDTIPLFKTYPFALPNIVASIVLIFAAIILFLFLEETEKRKRGNKDKGLEMGDYLKRKIGLNVPVRLYGDFIGEQNESLFHDMEIGHSDEEDGEIELSSFNKTVNQNEEFEQTNPFTFNVINTIISHFIMLLHVVVYGEFLPVFLGAPLLLKDLSFPFKIKGGFGFKESKIGNILSLNGVFGALSVIFILPFMIKKFNCLRTYKIALAIFPFCYFFLPEIIFTLPDPNSLNSNFLHVVLIYLNIIMKEFASVIAFSQIFILIHRASSPQHLAMINGYSLSMSSLASIFTPLIWGSLMTEFDKIKLSSLFWWILAFIASIGYFQSHLLLDY